MKVIKPLSPSVIMKTALIRQRYIEFIRRKAAMQGRLHPLVNPRPLLCSTEVESVHQKSEQEPVAPDPADASHESVSFHLEEESSTSEFILSHNSDQEAKRQKGRGRGRHKQSLQKYILEGG